MADIMSDMLKNCKFKKLKYPFLVNIVVDNAQMISLNSDNLKMKIYQKSSGKMIELLEVIGKSSGDNSNINIISNEKARGFFYIAEK